jgi:hypothetical protein
MPSQFEAAVAGNLGAMYVAFGLPAVYTSPDGTDTAGLIVRVQRHEVREVEIQARASGELQTGDVLMQDTGLKPVKGGRFVVEASEAWTVAATPMHRNGEYVCTCIRTGVERIMERRAKQG